ncbi:hypothetical protein [Rhizobium sp. RAF56]
MALLHNMVSTITGGSTGIGKAICCRFARKINASEGADGDPA